jgi:hypothetical protein
MRLSKILTAAALVSLVTAPIAAQAATPVRAASTHEGEDIAGISPLILVLIAAGLVAVILVASDNNNEPESP